MPWYCPVQGQSLRPAPRCLPALSVTLQRGDHPIFLSFSFPPGTVPPAHPRIFPHLWCLEKFKNQEQPKESNSNFEHFSAISCSKPKAGSQNKAKINGLKLPYFVPWLAKSAYFYLKSNISPQTYLFKKIHIIRPFFFFWSFFPPL